MLSSWSLSVRMNISALEFFLTLIQVTKVRYKTDAQRVPAEITYLNKGGPVFSPGKHVSRLDVEYASSLVNMKRLR